MNETFKQFLDSCDKEISEKQSSRIKELFNGNFSVEELTANLIVESRTTSIDFLQAYHNWLFDNYEINPKKK